MPIEYKRLTEKELNIFINMRINQLRENRFVSCAERVLYASYEGWNICILACL